MRAKIVSAMGIALTFTACAGAASPVPGALWANVKGPHTGTAATGASKMGKATCESVLGIIAWGDCSIETAKAHGGMTTVQYADVEVHNMLGIYSEYVTIVHGQ